ncbi:hypothetical protein MFKK_24790 [Halopseudomonas aestusnigri]|uniref:hypothetical protein n=1 Tax=Halopseudomonas TaxID=2901189 RepID=UPI0022B6CD4B|nr:MULTISPECIES: hypothetical protein [Halopseudomonas]BDX19669.1 hypothetical protein MFKK_24790 [Halopseudomonas aestusnigri]
MQTQPSNTCRVYLHPTAATNPAAIAAVIARTGMAIVIGGNRRGAALRASDRPEDLGPWNGGDAA